MEGEAVKAEKREALERLAEENPEALLLDGFEEAFVGIARRCGQPSLAVYDRATCVSILCKQGLSEEQAEEHFEFNVAGAWVGEHTPFVIEMC